MVSLHKEMFLFYYAKSIWNDKYLLRSEMIELRRDLFIQTC